MLDRLVVVVLKSNFTEAGLSRVAGRFEQTGSDETDDSACEEVGRRIVRRKQALRLQCLGHNAGDLQKARRCGVEQRPVNRAKAVRTKPIRKLHLAWTGHIGELVVVIKQEHWGRLPPAPVLVLKEEDYSSRGFLIVRIVVRKPSASKNPEASALKS